MLIRSRRGAVVWKKVSLYSKEVDYFQLALYFPLKRFKINYIKDRVIFSFI